MAASGPLYVERATILRVFPELYTVDVITDANRPLTNVPIGFAYSNDNHAGGFHYLPQEQSVCYVAMPADGTPFILCFVNSASVQVTDESAPWGAGVVTSYASNKEPLSPGDMRMATQDGNHVTVRRGGVVQLEATSLAQILLIPTDNLIRYYFQRFQARSPLGEIDWGHAELGLALSSDKKSFQNVPVLVKYNIKEYVQEDVSEEEKGKGRYTVELRVGCLSEKSETNKLGMLDNSEDGEHVFGKLGKFDNAEKVNGVISLVVYDHSQNVPPATFAFQVNRDGRGFLKLADKMYVDAKELHVTVTNKAEILKGETYARITDNIELGAAGFAELKADKGITIESKQTITLKCGGSSITISSTGITIDGDSIKLGGTAMDSVVRKADVLGALAGASNNGGPVVFGGLTSFTGSPKVKAS